MPIIENSKIQVDYVLQCINFIAKGRVRTLDPRRDVALREEQEIREAITGPFPMKRLRRNLRAPVLAEYETT